MVLLTLPRLILAGLLLTPSPAGAVFDDRELESIDTEVLFDSEYFLDLRGFSYPVEWDALWKDTGGVGYRINGASLDRTDLFLEQEARLPSRLNEWFSFAYALEHRGDKDGTSLHNWISLGLGPFRGITFALFGEPSFDKKDADIGLRTAYEFGEGSAIYASVNDVDFNFNKRGKTTALYGRKPYTYTAGAETRTGEHTLGLQAEIDTPLTLDLPMEGRIYKYRDTTLSVHWDHRPPVAPDWRVYGRAGYEFKRENDDYGPDPLGKTIEFHRKVGFLELAAVRGEFEAGTDYMRRGGESSFENRPVNDVRYTRWEIMPYARWRRKVRPWAVTEAALFFSFGERRQSYESDTRVSITDTIVEAKLGLGTDFLYGKSGRLGVYGTFDIDDAGRHIWDGGNVRAMFFFQ